MHALKSQEKGEQRLFLTSGNQQLGNYTCSWQVEAVQDNLGGKEAFSNLKLNSASLYEYVCFK